MIVPDLQHRAEAISSIMSKVEMQKIFIYKYFFLNLDLENVSIETFLQTCNLWTGQ